MGGLARSSARRAELLAIPLHHVSALLTCIERRYFYRMNADIERFRAQLKHFAYAYGCSVRELSVYITKDPTRGYDYINGKREPRYSTRRHWRAVMRRLRRDVFI